MTKRFILFATVLLPLSIAIAAEDYSKSSEENSPRYTFSWPLDGEHLEPRGGSSKGAPVTLDREPSQAWLALQEEGLSDQERDRRAILTMAGTYRINFDFLEIASFTAHDELNAPYQSWGTEKVYVDRNEPDFVSLVHILEMRLVQDDGQISDPIVTKHWRQDWRYQPTQLMEYTGRDQWAMRDLEP